MKFEAKPLSSTLSDEDVLTQSLGQPSMYRILVERYEAAFLRKARRILGHREEAKDVVVETFTKIYFNAKRFRPEPGANFRSWAYKILLNTSFSYYKKLGLGDRKLFAFSELQPNSFAEPRVEFEEQATTRDRVISTLARLPVALGRILRLYFIEDRSQAEIARQEGLSLVAVKTRIHRAKKEFRKLELFSNSHE